MACFVNSTESAHYQSQYCDRCQNWRDNGEAPGCPVWDLHLLWNYEQMEALGVSVTKREGLEVFIPGHDDRPQACRMFLKRVHEDLGPALPFPLEE